jgi:hypothetical protein
MIRLTKLHNSVFRENKVSFFYAMQNIRQEKDLFRSYLIKMMKLNILQNYRKPLINLGNQLKIRNIHVGLVHNSNSNAAV